MNLKITRIIDHEVCKNVTLKQLNELVDSLNNNKIQTSMKVHGKDDVEIIIRDHSFLKDVCIEAGINYFGNKKDYFDWLNEMMK